MGACGIFRSVTCLWYIYMYNYMYMYIRIKDMTSGPVLSRTVHAWYYGQAMWEIGITVYVPHGSAIAIALPTYLNPDMQSK